MIKTIFILFILCSSIQIANARALLKLLFGDKLSTENLQTGINVLSFGIPVGGGDSSE